MTKQEYDARLSQIHAAYLAAQKETLARHAIECGALKSQARAEVASLRAEYDSDA